MKLFGQNTNTVTDVKPEEPVVKKTSLFGNKPKTLGDDISSMKPMTEESHKDQFIDYQSVNKETGLIDVLNLKGIKQIYPGNPPTVLFNDFNFTIEDIPGEGQFVSLLGKSGCGKSTILRYISHLQQPTAGKIYMYGKELTENDHIPMVFQAYSSFHWMSVIENVALPLIINGTNKTESFDKAEEIIKLVGLQGQEKKWAKAPLLSGGQLQRVAIARSIIANPKILLLDEPFSGLDIRNRTALQNILLDLFYNPEVDVTFVLVTHDIREAVYLSNRLYVMKNNPGEISKQFNIDFGPQRRNRDTKYLPEFVNLTREIEDVYNNLG